MAIIFEISECCWQKIILNMALASYLVQKLEFCPKNNELKRKKQSN